MSLYGIRQSGEIFGPLGPRVQPFVWGGRLPYVWRVGLALGVLRTPDDYRRINGQDLSICTVPAALMAIQLRGCMMWSRPLINLADSACTTSARLCGQSRSTRVGIYYDR